MYLKIVCIIASIIISCLWKILYNYHSNELNILIKLKSDDFSIQDAKIQYINILIVGLIVLSFDVFSILFFFT